MHLSQVHQPSKRCISCSGRCSPTEFTEFTESTGRGCPPTEFTEFTESTGRDVLPQISRNSQNRLAEMFSHRFHRFSQMVCVWSSVNSVCSVGPPTPPVNLCKSVQSVGGLFSTLLQNRLAEDVLPQNSRNSQNRLAEMFSHRFHRFSQNVLAEDVLPQISQNSQNRLAEYVLSQILTDGACLEFCEFCVFCGTSYAPSESVRICEICGRITETSAPPIGLRRLRGSRRVAGSG